MKGFTAEQNAVDAAYDLYVAASELTDLLPWDLLFGDGHDLDVVDVKVGLGTLRRLRAIVAAIQHSTESDALASIKQASGRAGLSGRNADHAPGGADGGNTGGNGR
jgi:hypothetical protein